MRDCHQIYIEAGKCKQNYEGKVILPSGMFVPRDIPGAYLKDCIDEWHFHHPNQLSTAAMVYTVSQQSIHPSATVSSARAMTSSATIYKLSPSDCIATLEAEILTLKVKQSALIHFQTQKPINLNAEE